MFVLANLQKIIIFFVTTLPDDDINMFATFTASDSERCVTLFSMPSLCFGTGISCLISQLAVSFTPFSQEPAKINSTKATMPK